VIRWTNISSNCKFLPTRDQKFFGVLNGNVSSATTAPEKITSFGNSREAGSSALKNSFANDASDSQLFRVRWREHNNRLSDFISSLYGDEETSDMKLVSKMGISVSAHRLVMAAASPLLRDILKVRHVRQKQMKRIIIMMLAFITV